MDFKLLPAEDKQALRDSVLLSTSPAKRTLFVVRYFQVSKSILMIVLVRVRHQEVFHLEMDRDQERER